MNRSRLHFFLADRSMKPSFEGSKTSKLDSKGRMAFPASFRTRLGEDYGSAISVTIASEGCLAVFSPDEWSDKRDELARMIRAQPRNRRLRRFVRMVVGAKETIVLDRQGRALIPEHLREYAGLDGEAMVVGCLDRLEIWDRERHKAHMVDGELGTFGRLEDEFDAPEADPESGGDETCGGIGA